MESVYENGGFIGKTLAFGDPEFYQIEGTIPRGEAQFTTPGTTSWTAPAGVTSVCAVAVGGGGGGNSQNGAGGHGGAGGGLGWKNNISVTPGVSYTVVVGAGGARATSASAGNGANSYFIDATTVAGLGGQGGGDNRGSTGGSYVGDGGGDGGDVPSHTSTLDATGGGGAGGYSGNGGTAGSINTNNAVAGSGGGGGGGGAGGNSDAGGGGGGVGIYGEGSNGTAGVYNGGDGTGGGGGSGGTNAPNPTSTANPANGGLYGGGGGGAENSNENGPGGGGAVRIIWGGERAFPSTNTANGQGTTTGLTNGNRKNSGIWLLQSVIDTIVSAPTVEFIGVTDIGTDGTTFAFNGVSIGSESDDRLVVVVIETVGFTSDATKTALTLNGNAMTDVHNVVNLFGNQNVAYYRLTSGTTANVSVTYSGTKSRSSCAIYTVKGQSSDIPSDTDSQTTASLTVDLPKGSAGLFTFGATGSTVTTTWSGATEDLDQAVGGEGTNSISTARELNQTLGYTVTATHSAGTGAAVYTATVWS